MPDLITYNKYACRLTVDCPGYVNWSQPRYCEPLFRLLMRSLNITVTTQQGSAINVGAQKIDIGFYAKLIVYMLGGNDGDWFECSEFT